MGTVGKAIGRAGWRGMGQRTAHPFAQVAVASGDEAAVTVTPDDERIEFLGLLLGGEDVFPVGRRFEPQVSCHELTELYSFVGPVRTVLQSRAPAAVHAPRPTTLTWSTRH
ncbi:MAG: hypothetical protein IT190_09600 [Microbacteriaceae bacterium]|nr:hypothetical protein [Microbacteriaceae bacterium]